MFDLGDEYEHTVMDMPRRISESFRVPALGFGEAMDITTNGEWQEMAAYKVLAEWPEPPPAVAPCDKTACPDCGLAKLPEYDRCLWCQELADIKPANDRAIRVYDNLMASRAECDRRQRWDRTRNWRVGVAFLLAGLAPFIVGTGRTLEATLAALVVLVAFGPPWYRAQTPVAGHPFTPGSRVLHGGRCAHFDTGHCRCLRTRRMHTGGHEEHGAAR